MRKWRSPNGTKLKLQSEQNEPEKDQDERTTMDADELKRTKTDRSENQDAEEENVTGEDEEEPTLASVTRFFLWLSFNRAVSSALPVRALSRLPTASASDACPRRESERSARTRQAEA